MASTPSSNDPLLIGGRQFNSRLFTGTGKYPTLEAMQQSLERSDCEMVTVAVRRVQTHVHDRHNGDLVLWWHSQQNTERRRRQPLAK